MTGQYCLWCYREVVEVGRPVRHRDQVSPTGQVFGDVRSVGLGNRPK